MFDTYTDLTTVAHRLDDGSRIECTITSATHIYITAPDGGVLYRGRHYYISGHAYLSEGGTWAFGSKATGFGLYCPDLSTTGMRKISEQILTYLNASMSTKEGLELRRRAEMIDCSNTGLRLKDSRSLLVQQLHELDSKIEECVKRCADAQNGTLPTHYVEP